MPREGRLGSGIRLVCLALAHVRKPGFDEDLCVLWERGRCQTDSFTAQSMQPRDRYKDAYFLRNGIDLCVISLQYYTPSLLWSTMYQKDDGRLRDPKLLIRDNTSEKLKLTRISIPEVEQEYLKE